jgi:hypothetical protein
MATTHSTQTSLSRIEETLAALCAEVSVVRAKVEALEGGTGQMTPQETLDFLDGYRAAEAMAANAFGAWIAASDTPCLRGGLRAVQMREAYHARLFEERIKELGGSPKAEMDDAAEAFLMSFGDERSDAEKVDAFMKAAGDPKVLDQLEAQAARLNNDEETQFLLRSVIEDERASLALVKQAHEMLCGG